MWPINCFVETEGPVKVTGSHVHCKSDSISEMVQDGCCYYRLLIECPIWFIE